MILAWGKPITPRSPRSISSEVSYSWLQEGLCDFSRCCEKDVAVILSFRQERGYRRSPRHWEMLIKRADHHCYSPQRFPHQVSGWSVGFFLSSFGVPVFGYVFSGRRSGGSRSLGGPRKCRDLNCFSEGCFGCRH